MPSCRALCWFFVILLPFSGSFRFLSTSLAAAARVAVVKFQIARSLPWNTDGVFPIACTISKTHDEIIVYFCFAPTSCITNFEVLHQHTCRSMTRDRHKALVSSSAQPEVCVT